MKKIVLTILLPLMVLSHSCSELNLIIEDSGLTNEEVIEGLRSALTVSTDTSVSTLSAVDGYFADDLVKILLPDEASVIVNNISKVPGGNLLVNQTVLAVNRAAEDAAVEARPIFLDAISGITIDDGFAILNGGVRAATDYLKAQTDSALGASFQPKITNSLSKKLVGNASAESVYADLIDAYNKASLNGLLFPKITTNSLSEHTTRKALDGLYEKVAVEESLIRTDARHRVNEILQKVFGS